MTRAMYGTGDVLSEAGHQISYLFAGHFATWGPATLRRFMVPLKLPFLVRHLIKQGQQFDVIEVHEPLAAPYCFLRHFFMHLPPIVVFSHGLEERSRLVELRYRKQKGLPVSLKKRYSPMSVVLQANYGTRHSNHVICLNSEDIKHLCLSGVPEDRLTLLPNGVEEELLAAGQAAGLEDGNRSGILFVGSWLIRKGILDLVPAITQVLRHHPKLSFTAAGSGVDAEIVKQGFPKDVQNQVGVIQNFSGNEALIDLYKRHSIFVLPSYFEGHPLVMIEAAAFGMAIVTTGICGMVDFIEDGRNGLLVNVGDPVSLEEGLERLITDTGLARRLGEAARLTAREHTWARSADITLQAYEKAVCNASLSACNGRTRRSAKS